METKTKKHGALTTSFVEVLEGGKKEKYILLTTSAISNLQSLIRDLTYYGSRNQKTAVLLPGNILLTSKMTEQEIIDKLNSLSKEELIDALLDGYKEISELKTELVINGVQGSEPNRGE